MPRALALLLGWGWAAALVALSLAPALPSSGIAQGDKLGHLLGYGLLMYVFCRLYAAPRTRLAYAVGWTAMGVALEFAQRAIATRSFEPADMAANAAGVALGWTLAQLAHARG